MVGRKAYMIGQFQILYGFLSMNVFVELQAKLQTCLAKQRHSYITDVRSSFKRAHVLAHDAPIKKITLVKKYYTIELILGIKFLCILVDRLL